MYTIYMYFAEIAKVFKQSIIHYTNKLWYSSIFFNIYYKFKMVIYAVYIIILPYIYIYIYMKVFYDKYSNTLTEPLYKSPMS